jgi:methylmalonyl-CoA/ethylmalonyl-CoA epimerase
MSMLSSRIDHVAIGVHDLDIAQRRWRDQLGGVVVAWNDPAAGFSSRQLRYRGGGKLELIAPVQPGDGSFMDRFLDKFGSRIHHVTLKVLDLHDALPVVASAGLDTVDVDDRDPAWQEAFLRPSQVGGLIVQIARTDQSDEDWARAVGHTPEPVREDAAILHGPLLSHPDLDAAARLWTLLGAEVERGDNRLECRWDDCPLTVVIVRGETAGPVALRFAGAARYPTATRIGPEVRPEREAAKQGSSDDR